MNNLNWFVFIVGMIQMGGTAFYIHNGKPMFGMLYFLYALSNFVIFFMKGE